ncbi:MAG: hypothetical protein M3N46_03525 [Actinomycetota bacterium]|nr:hypothetical protein [Actinomycetota bacterium]
MIAVTNARSTRRWTVRLAAVLVTMLASCSVALFGAPTAAHAATSATQVVQFSADGIHWSDSYTNQLFHGVVLVPGGSATRYFYVRNAATEAAILQVTLADVTTTSIPLADAMSISSSTTGAPGATVPVSLAQPCYTLSQGLRLASGDSIRIDNTVSLGNLNGTAGQTASVWFSLRVSFSSTDAAAPVPNACPTDYGTVDTFPNQATPGVTTPARTFGSPAVYHRTAAGWTLGTSVGRGTITTPTTPTTTVQPSTPLVQTLVSNTGRFYQEYDVAFWLAMSVLGAVILVLVSRRRAEEQPEEPALSQEIGSRR